jgi:hypothetical protein
MRFACPQTQDFGQVRWARVELVIDEGPIIASHADGILKEMALLSKFCSDQGELVQRCLQIFGDFGCNHIGIRQIRRVF